MAATTKDIKGMIFLAAFWIVVIGGGFGYCKYQRVTERRAADGRERERAAEIQAFATETNGVIPDWKVLPDAPMTADVQALLAGKVVLEASLSDIAIIDGKRTAILTSSAGPRDLRLELEIATDISSLGELDDALVLAEIRDVKPGANENDPIIVRGRLTALHIIK